MPSRTPKAEPPLEPFEIESDRPRERPILFSAEMVRAILGGRKTQTRRVVKPQPNAVRLTSWGCRAGQGFGWFFNNPEEFLPASKFPYGGPGDRLWVRETWSDCCDIYANCAIAYKADGTGRQYLCENSGDGDPIALTGSAILPQEMNEPVKWKPSIHMPRWASRITLEVTEVRVERVQEISEEDAIAEGIKSYNDGLWKIYTPTTSFGTSNPRKSFESLWESINGTKHPWAANPWVWVVSFKRVEATP